MSVFLSLHASGFSSQKLHFSLGGAQHTSESLADVASERSLLLLLEESSIKGLSQCAGVIERRQMLKVENKARRVLEKYMWQPQKTVCPLLKHRLTCIPTYLNLVMRQTQKMLPFGEE